jgi:symplekin
LDGKDKTFSRFLLDLPSVSADVLGLLRELCVDAEKYVLFISVFSCN